MANIGRQVADTLDYAHKQGITHRDVKPSNLLLDLRGTVWVTDFGLAKVAGPGGDNLTHTGDILGTLRYMPPEAFEGRSDVRGDVYSLGLTLYEILTMRPAFDEKDRHKLIKQVTTGEPAHLDKIRREIPRDLVTIIHKAIDRDPNHRYASAGDLAADLQRFLDDEPVLARRQTQLERYVRWARHNPGIAVLGGVLTAVLVLVTVASLLVAGHMADLARNEAKSADDERAARNEAVEAQVQATEERTQAERAKSAAEESKKRAEQALQKAEENYAKARAAVNDYLTAVSEDDRLKAPGLNGLRIQLLQSALQFYQEFLKERGNDSALRRELAAVFFKVGQIYSDLGQFPTAAQSFAQSLRLYEALAVEAPDDEVVQDGLAKVLFKQGQYTRAINLWEKLIRPDDPRYHADLGWAYNQVAFNAKNNNKKKNPALELEFLRKALAIRERLVKLRPDDPEARQGLAASLNNIAANLKAEHKAEQLPLYRRAVEEMEVAYKLRPSDPITLQGVIILVRNLADVTRVQGNADEAVAAYHRVAEVLDRRARDNPEVPGTAAEMMTGYQTLAWYLRELGRLDEAARVVRQGRDRAAEINVDDGTFFMAEGGFYLEALTVAEARAKGAADVRSDVEPAATAAVASLRNYLLTGWRDSSWLKTNPLPAPLRERADYKELIAQVEVLSKAEQVAKSAQSAPAEKVTARETCLAALEALAAPEPNARHARRALAQARQSLGQAYLDAGLVEEARTAFDDALALREKIIREAPANEQLRADLVQSQSAAGDLFAAAGRLADAAKTWDKALATLEDSLKTNPNSIAIQTVLAERLRHVADQYATFGLWDTARKHYRRAFEVQVPTDFQSWYLFADLLKEAEDGAELRSFTNRVVDLLAADKGLEALNVGRIILLSSDAAARYPKAIKQIALKNINTLRDWRDCWQGLAAIRRGDADKSLPLLEQVKDPLQKLPALALALHQLGRTDAARAALQEAEQVAEERLRNGLGGADLKLPDAWWSDWLLCRSLRREAHQAIHGQALPDSPYERLFRARVLLALDQTDKADAEFAAAVQVRPDDADVWLTRSRIYARLGHKDRTAADLAHAQQLKADDPLPWIQSGRLLAEQGEDRQADAAYARASILGKGELNRYLEAGWWVVGPYPDQLELACPPEWNPDPSKPVSALGGKGNLQWQTVPTTPHSGKIQLPDPIGGQAKASSYALSYVYADRERTATLRLWPKNDARVWLNGRLVFAGFGEGKITSSIEIPVTLRTGRNALLVKNRHDKGVSCECAFMGANTEDDYARLAEKNPDQPRLWIDLGRRLGEVGRWDEATRAFARAVELKLKDPQVWQERGRAFADLGKWDEAAADFAQTLDLRPAKAVTLYHGWWTERHGIDDAVLRHAEVYDRLRQLRPSNASRLVARKGE